MSADLSSADDLCGATHADDCWSWGPGHYKCAVRKIERLRTENERLREDAERYRWLRRGGNDDIGVVRGFDVIEYGSSSVADTYEDSLCGDRLDAAIDAALAKENSND